MLTVIITGIADPEPTIVRYQVDVCYRDGTKGVARWGTFAECVALIEGHAVTKQLVSAMIRDESGTGILAARVCMNGRAISWEPVR